jgi:hypothetical protein
MARALLPPVVRLVLAALLAVAAVNPLAAGPAALAVQERNADDDDREIELVSPAARATLRPHRTTLRSAHATRAFSSREAGAGLHPLIVRNPFTNTLGERLRC